MNVGAVLRIAAASLVLLFAGSVGSDGFGREMAQAEVVVAPIPSSAAGLPDDLVFVPWPRFNGGDLLQDLDWKKSPYSRTTSRSTLTSDTYDAGQFSISWRFDPATQNKNSATDYYQLTLTVTQKHTVDGDRGARGYAPARLNVNAYLDGVNPLGVWAATPKGPSVKKCVNPLSDVLRFVPVAGGTLSSAISSWALESLADKTMLCDEKLTLRGTGSRPSPKSPPGLRWEVSELEWGTLIYLSGIVAVADNAEPNLKIVTYYDSDYFGSSSSGVPTWFVSQQLRESRLTVDYG